MDLGLFFALLAWRLQWYFPEWVPRRASGSRRRQPAASLQMIPANSVSCWCCSSCPGHTGAIWADYRRDGVIEYRHFGRGARAGRYNRPAILGGMPADCFCRVFFRKIAGAGLCGRRKPDGKESRGKLESDCVRFADRAVCLLGFIVSFLIVINI